jgi:hypothetical protein
MDILIVYLESARRLIIWARECDRDRSVFTSDTFLSLEKYTNPLSVTYDNNQFLSQATTEDLYNMAVKNGCQMSYTQYTRDVGSLIVLDAGIDFGLSPQDAPGVLKNVQLGLTCNFINTSDRSLNVQMFVLAVYEGVFNVIDGNTSLILAPLSVDDVLNAKRKPGVTYKQQASVYGGGGNLFRSLGNAFKSAHRFVKDNKLVSTALGAFPHPGTRAASVIARQLGYGGDGRSGGTGRSGGRAPRRRAMRGGNLDVEGGDLNDYSENENEVEFEYEQPIKKTPQKQNILNRLRNRKITKASDLAEDY